jgi:hypothetical protein
MVAGRTAVHYPIMDRGTHRTTEVPRIRRAFVRQGRLDERLSASPGQGSWISRANDLNMCSTR